jgi:hypothetical protein
MFFKKEKFIIEHQSLVDNDVDLLQLSSLSIPEWYKKTDRIKSIDAMLTGVGTMKLCMPFLESFTTGYNVILPIDLLVLKEGDNQIIKWGLPIEIATPRINQKADTVPTFDGYSDVHWTWQFTGSLKVPKGTSMIFMHPMNRLDLPFYTLGGVIDGDFSMHSEGNIPFFLKKDFSGVIPQGTPIAQVIPFKNVLWKKQKSKDIIEEGNKNKIKSGSVIYGWYKKNYWKKKDWQ